MKTSTNTTTVLAGPALMAEGLRRIAEADAVIKTSTGSIDDRVASAPNRFNGERLGSYDGVDRYAVYAAHLRETGHALLLAAQTAAMVASGIHLPDGEQLAWQAACAGVDQLNQPAAPKRR